MNSVVMQGVGPVGATAKSPTSAAGDFMAALADALAPSAGNAAAPDVARNAVLADAATGAPDPTQVPAPTPAPTDVAPVVAPVVADTVRSLPTAAAEIVASPDSAMRDHVGRNEDPADPVPHVYSGSTVNSASDVAVARCSAELVGARRPIDPSSSPLTASASRAPAGQQPVAVLRAHVRGPLSRPGGRSAYMSGHGHESPELRGVEMHGVDLGRVHPATGSAVVPTAMSPAVSEPGDGRDAQITSAGPAVSALVAGTVATASPSTKIAPTPTPTPTPNPPATVMRIAIATATSIDATTVDPTGATIDANLTTIDDDPPRAADRRTGDSVPGGSDGSTTTSIRSATPDLAPAAAPTSTSIRNAAPTAAAPAHSANPAGLGMIGTDRVDRVRQQTIGKPVQRLTVDLDDARVAVRVRGDRVAVDVLRDPGAVLGQGWAHDVERTLETAMRAQESAPAHMPFDRDRPTTGTTTRHDQSADRHTDRRPDGRGEGGQPGHEHRRGVPWWLTEEEE